MQIDNPEIAIAVRRDRKAVRKRRVEFEHKISPGEIYLFEGSAETTTCTEQHRYLRWNMTRQVAFEFTQF